jgi:predicted RNA-binding protein with RPS1 domain
MTAGEHCIVTVNKILERGAVVSINGTDKTAFIHISKISSAYVTNIAEYIDIGQSYDAECLDPEKPELSLKHLNLRPKFSEPSKDSPDRRREMSLDEMIAKANAAFQDKQRKKGTLNKPPRLRRKNDRND